MTKQEFIDWAISRGWQLDEKGHLRRGKHRLVVTKTKVRYELEYRIEPNLFYKGHVEWNHILTAKLAKLKLTEWGNIRGYPW